MRRTVLIVLAALVAVVTLGSAVVATSGEASTVTRPRLERSLATTFAHLYAHRAQLQGRDLTAASLGAEAMCDKAGAQDRDVGPGGDWVCLMSWTDPEVPMPPRATASSSSTCTATTATPPAAPPSSPGSSP